VGWAVPRGLSLWGGNVENGKFFGRGPWSAILRPALLDPVRHCVPQAAIHLLKLISYMIRAPATFLVNNIDRSSPRQTVLCYGPVRVFAIVDSDENSIP